MPPPGTRLKGEPGLLASDPTGLASHSSLDNLGGRKKLSPIGNPRLSRFLLTKGGLHDFPALGRLRCVRRVVLDKMGEWI